MAAGCGSTGISPRPMLMGAAHDALRASNARVSLSCLRVLAHRLPHLLHGLVFIALLFSRGPVLRTCNRVMAYRPTGSAQTDRIRLPYTAPEASRRAFFVKELFGDAAWKGGKHAAPGPGSVQIKAQDGDNQLRFQPPAQIFIYLGTRKTVKVIACPRRQRGDVAGIVPDYPVHRFGVAPDSGGDYRIRDQRRPRARRFNHPLHLPSAPSAADRLSACGC